MAEICEICPINEVDGTEQEKFEAARWANGIKAEEDARVEGTYSRFVEYGAGISLHPLSERLKQAAVACSQCKIAKTCLISQEEEV